jgi:hypothetical protein
MSAFPSRGVAGGGDRALALLVAAALAAAALAGLAAARGSMIVLGGLAWLALVIIGLRYPALPLGLAAAAYVLISAQPADNALSPGAEQIHDELAGPLTPADALLGAAAVAAVATVDECLGVVVDAVERAGGVCLVTADHGNAEQMLEPDGVSPHTAHTLNPVPLVVTAEGLRLRDDGELSDLVPTALGLLGLDSPPEMTGRGLVITD